MKINVLMLMLGVLFLTSCSEDDDPEIIESQTIVDIASDDDQFSTLVAALQRTNLVATLEGTGPFTVFAPTNDAFNQLGVDLATISDADLTNILLYHVLGGSIASTDLGEGQTYASTAAAAGPNGTALSVLIERQGSSVSINGEINVTTANVNASNGIIHIVDKVIQPLDIVGHAIANENFTSLVSALSSAPGDLVNVLGGQGPFTVFAPVNSAFDAIADVVATLTPEQLATVLTYHVIAGSNVLSSDLSDDMAVMTVSGQEFTVDLDSNAAIIDQSGATTQIIFTDVQATNGVIHVVENVILPTL